VLSVCDAEPLPPAPQGLRGLTERARLEALRARHFGRGPCAGISGANAQPSPRGTKRAGIRRC